MTAVCLRQKNVVQTETWLSVFPALGTEAKSNIFMKQLTTICISTILHLRKILPDGYFDSKSFEGMSLKFLKWGMGYSYANKIKDWLDGAFEAIDKKYLKNLMLDIKDNESKLTLEIYTITFNYKKGNEGINVLRSENNLGNENINFSQVNASATNQNTIRLLQMCQAVTQTCADLPAQVTLAIRLSYYEDTPEDYQPRGYKAFHPSKPAFLKSTRSLQVGITGTNYHSFKLVNKSCFNDNFLKMLEENTSSKVKQEPQNDDEPPPKKFCTSLENNQPPGTFEPISNENISNLPHQQELSSKRLRCPCSSAEVSQIMFRCYVCKFLAHAECFGVLEFNCDKKIRFYCHICHQSEGKPKCHDTMLTNLKNSSDQQKLALLRRFLKYCCQPDVMKITLHKIKKIAGPKCSKDIIQIVVNKMMETQIVIPHHMRKSFLIDKAQLSNKIHLYFYQLQYTNSSQDKVETGSGMLKRHNPVSSNFFVHKCRKSTVSPQIIGTQQSQMSNSELSLQYYL